MTDEEFTHVVLLVHNRTYQLGEEFLPHNERLKRQYDRDQATVELANVAQSLLEEIERQRKRADRIEGVLADLASEQSSEAWIKVGVAKALAAIEKERLKAVADEEKFGDWDGGSQFRRNVQQIEEVAATVRRECGRADLPPHEQTLADNRRMREALERIAADRLSGADAVLKFHEARKIASEVLKEDA